MSHEVESMMSAEGKVPWHKTNCVVIDDDAVSTTKALELAGLDWEVELQPSGFMHGDRFIEADNAFHVVRNTDQRIVGSVGSRYNPLQNRDGFSWGDDLLAAAEGAHWITAGSLKKGQQVWMLAKLPETAVIAGMEDEVIQPYILISNSHDGSTGLRADIVTIRVVCNNTFTAALQGAKRTVKVRHTKNMAKRMHTAKDVLGVKTNYLNKLVEVGSEMAKTEMSMRQFDNFLEKLVPTKDEDGAKKEGRALTMATDKQEQIKVIYTNTDDLQNIKGTRWGALQAVVDFHDHHVESRGEDKGEKRMQRILNPTPANLTHKAFALLS